MNQPNNGNWSASPWLGTTAEGQWTLWRAGCEWAARSGWFASSDQKKPQENASGPPAKPRDELK